MENNKEDISKDIIQLCDKILHYLYRNKPSQTYNTIENNFDWMDGTILDDALKYLEEKGMLIVSRTGQFPSYEFPAKFPDGFYSMTNYEDRKKELEKQEIKEDAKIELAKQQIGSIGKISESIDSLSSEVADLKQKYLELKKDLKAQEEKSEKSRSRQAKINIAISIIAIVVPAVISLYVLGIKKEDESLKKQDNIENKANKQSIKDSIPPKVPYNISPQKP